MKAVSVVLAVIFLSTPSVRRATAHAAQRSGRVLHFYPRPPRGGRQCTALAKNERQHFYPRPPRGGRHGGNNNSGFFGNISIHALREEGDLHEPPPQAAPSQFLSTPSARRATSEGDRRFELVGFLSTPSARRATFYSSDTNDRFYISIHALREEGDFSTVSFHAAHWLISIHALREEGDWLRR